METLSCGALAQRRLKAIVGFAGAGQASLFKLRGGDIIVWHSVVSRPSALQAPGRSHPTAHSPHCSLQRVPAGANPGWLRQLAVLLCCPLLEDVAAHGPLLAGLCHTLVRGWLV